MDFEDNPNNPTITRVEKVNVRHHFIIRYMDDDMKKQMREIILQLINKHEIGDFYIEETKAFKTNRILYNFHTLVTEHDSFNFSVIDEKFLKHLKKY